MLNSIRVEKLRGIREGQLDGLTRVSVLVGPNGCGKSTLLDAMLIGGSDNVGFRLAQVTRERSPFSLVWLVHRLDAARDIELALSGVGGTRVTGMEVSRHGIQLLVTTTTGGVEKKTSGVWRPSSPSVDLGLGEFDFNTSFLGGFGLAAPQPLETAFSAHVAGGTRRLVEDLLRELLPELERLEVLVEQDKGAQLHAVFPSHSVPVALTGQGMLLVVRAALRLSSVRRGTVLIEEPETHQHPASMRLLAQLFFAAARRGVQLVISTHSIEFIDMLAAAANGDDELAWLSVHRLKLTDGLLSVSNIPGPDVAFARSVIHDDLR